MKTRKALFGTLLASAFVLAACSQPAEIESDDVIEVESSEEMMADEDEMADEEMMEEDDAMADSDMMQEQTTFVIQIKNTSPEGGLTVLAPGAYELNDHPLSFFAAGEADRGLGLEALAEDGDPSVLAGTIGEMMGGDEMAGFMVSVFNTPVGADSAGPAGPGASYEFSVEAYPGQYLTLATMFVQSNDWFFAPGEEGLELFNAEGLPISGDITDLFFLWNAGTEVDQTPGEGADQAPRQSGPNTGEIENGLVSLVEDFTNFNILITITPQS